MYYVRFKTMITIPCLERWANTWIGWQTNLVWSSTHPEQYLKIRNFEKRKLNVWSLIIWSQEGNQMIEYQKYWKSRSIIRDSEIPYFMPLHLHLIIWSSEHFKSRKILAHCSKPESLKLIEQKPKMSPSHNKNLNGKTEYSIDLMP